MMKVSASILAANLANAGEECKKVIDAGVDSLHIDVMDGQFVPNITFGVGFLADVVKYCQPNIPVYSHMMVLNVDNFLSEFSKYSDGIIVHAEGCQDVVYTLNKIRDYGIKAGLALSPAIHESTLEHLLEYLDIILVMTVSPGFCGQSFMYSQIAKIKNIKNLISIYPKISLTVDGGIKENNVGKVYQAGADTVVIGSGLFINNKYKENLLSIQQAFSSNL